MKFNVSHWTGKEWKYVATAQAINEQEAARMIASRFTLKGRFASYPHMDDYAGQVTSKTPFTEVV